MANHEDHVLVATASLRAKVLVGSISLGVISLAIICLAAGGLTTMLNLSMWFIIAVFIVGGIEVPTRRYEFTASTIRMRRLFRWFTYPIPARLALYKSQDDVIAISDADPGEDSLFITREFNNNGLLYDALLSYYGDLGKLMQDK